MRLIDSHCHIYHLSEKEFDEYLRSAMEQGVDGLIAVGADYKTSSISRNFANRSENVWFTAGVHPHEAQKFIDNNSRNLFSDLFEEPKFVAIGEIGLDYYYEHSEKNAQKKVFEYFLDIALKLNAPAVIHCRDKDGQYGAYEDVYNLLVDFVDNNGKFVIHCFTGTLEWCEKFIDIGAYIGITGIITFPKAKMLRQVLNIIPPERLLIETDSPYLAPVPYRGKTNQSAYLREIADFISEHYGININSTTENAKRFFCISENRSNHPVSQI